jgi:hypothetical protein
MLLPEVPRDPEFWVRVLQVLKAIFDLIRVWKSH